MIQVCIFMPFLHNETVKPVNVPRTPPSKDQDQHLMNQIAAVLDMRNRIAEN